MIFEVWQASESMKIQLKNDAKYGTGSDIQFLSLLLGFWMDFGSIFVPFWMPDDIKSWEKSGMMLSMPCEAARAVLWRLLVALGRSGA